MYISPELFISYVIKKYNDRSKEYHNYKYGFYPLEDYNQIKELPHKIIKDEKPERNIENGLSNYSSENNIPSQLFLYDIEYKYNKEDYDMIKYYFNFTYKLFGLNETFIFISNLLLLDRRIYACSCAKTWNRFKDRHIY